jgi:CrcB protein
MKHLLLAFVGGGIGASARYWLSGSVYRFMSSSFPYGTMLVNVLGCFLIGFLMAFLGDRFIVNPALRVFLTIGILGGFTTFSTFSYETVSMLRDAQYFGAMSNIAFTVFNCLGGTWLGLEIGRLL